MPVSKRGSQKPRIFTWYNPDINLFRFMHGVSDPELVNCNLGRKPQLSCLSWKLISVSVHSAKHSGRDVVSSVIFLLGPRQGVNSVDLFG